MKLKPALLVLGLLLAPAVALAGDPHGMHGENAADSAAVESTRSFEAANMKMHKDMTLQYTGDADVDFMRSMIPHHQGAIDMANVVLKYGKDPETRKLAMEIIKAQEAEIALMKERLAKRQK